MNKVLNHLYYSIYCWIYWSWTVLDIKKNNTYFKTFGEDDASTDSPSMYVLIVSLYLYWLVVLLTIKINEFFVVEYAPYSEHLAFIICFIVAGIICYYYSFMGKRYQKYFKKFKKQDDLTRFWWHVLSFLEIVFLVLIWVLILSE